MAPTQIGRYELLHAIASGGMATVYLARARGARGFERHVALKVMHPHLAEDPEFVAMFLDEARMVANIRHPNVVPTLDVVEEEGQLFLVMEYIEGLSLQALIRAVKKRRQNLPIDCALRVAVDMLTGLHAAHELVATDGSPMNLVHRDVSPHNVMIGVDGIGRIMDFGVARAENRINSTMGANPKGKLPYMSPEQLLGRPIDRRSDVYSAGIVLWEMLAGTGLFRADNEGMLTHMVAAGTTRSPIDANPSVPPALSAACMRALAVAVDDRYPTAVAFADALEEAAKQAQVAIAAPRAISAMVKEIPPEKALRSGASSATGGSGSPDSIRPSSGSGVANTPTPVSVSPSSGDAAKSAPGADTSPFGGTGGTGQTPTPASSPSPVSSPPTADLVTQGSVEIPARRSGAGIRSVLLVAAAASVATGALVWFLLRAGDDHASAAGQQDLRTDSSSAEKTVSSAAPAALAAPSATPSASPSDALNATPSAAPSASSAAQGSASTPSGKNAAKAPATTPSRPGARSEPRTTKPGKPGFRPEVL